MGSARHHARIRARADDPDGLPSRDRCPIALDNRQCVAVFHAHDDLVRMDSLLGGQPRPGNTAEDGADEGPGPARVAGHFGPSDATEGAADGATGRDHVVIRREPDEAGLNNDRGLCPAYPEVFSGLIDTTPLGGGEAAREKDREDNEKKPHNASGGQRTIALRARMIGPSMITKEVQRDTQPQADHALFAPKRPDTIGVSQDLPLFCHAKH